MPRCAQQQLFASATMCCLACTTAHAICICGTAYTMCTLAISLVLCSTPACCCCPHPLQGWQGHPERHLLPVPVTPLLSSAVELVLSFSPACWDVVVSVARKTDASLWPALFSAVGSPAALLALLLEAGALPSAACFLIVVDRWACVGLGGIGWRVRGTMQNPAVVCHTDAWPSAAAVCGCASRLERGIFGTAALATANSLSSGCAAIHSVCAAPCCHPVDAAAAARWRVPPSRHATSCSLTLLPVIQLGSCTVAHALHVARPALTLSAAAPPSPPSSVGQAGGC